MYKEQFTRVKLKDGELPEFPLSFSRTIKEDGVDIVKPIARKYSSYVNRRHLKPFMVGHADRVVVPMFPCKEKQVEENCKVLMDIATNAEPTIGGASNNRIIVEDDNGNKGFVIL